MTKKIILPLIFFLSILTFSENELSAEPISPKKIILLAGPKSHRPTVHEYLKMARLIKTMFEKSPNVEELNIEIYDKGWPDDPSTLDDADLILIISDGRDGPTYDPVPFSDPEKMDIISKQIQRGCNYSAIHFSTFAYEPHRADILEWGGGYFDWKEDTDKKNWYSVIKTTEGDVKLLTANHSITNGLTDFHLNDEFYYNIRFKPEDQGLIPIAAVPSLGSSEPMGNVVAWAVDRSNGNRGFCTTMGHFYDNWKNDSFRKLMLNGILWAAGAEVPAEGVESLFYDDRQVTQFLFGASVKGLILTGNQHPAHLWKETTPVLKSMLEEDERIHVDVSTDIEDLSQYDLHDYDFLLMNYCNWEDSTGLSEGAKSAFSSYIREGGGLLLIHFANGAFHASLPGAAASDWPEYRQICRRVWDHKAGSQHDKYGPFTVHITDVPHELTKGLSDFHTTDELYYQQSGEAPIEPLLTAQSKDTGKEEPLAWTYQYGKGRVFQTLLGHDVAALQAEALRELIRRAGIYVARSSR